MTQVLDQLTVDPDDGEAFEAAADALVDQFEAWLSDHGLDATDGWVAYQLLQAKCAYVDGALARWTVPDLHEVLLDVFPRKVMVDADEVERLVPTAERFFEFLDARGMVGPGGDDCATLVAELRRLAPAVADAMRDPSRFGMGKALFTAMLDDGVDIDDPAAVEQWVAAYNAELGGGILGAPAPRMPPVPPVDLPDEATLAAAAQATPLARQLAAFVDWVGKGRTLTQAGNLRVADGKALVEVLGTGDAVDPRIGDHARATRSATDLGGVDLVFRVALQAGLARRQRGRLATTRRGRQAARDPLETWQAAATALLDLGVLTWRDNQWRPWWSEELDSGVGELLFTLYLAGEVEVADLAASAVKGIGEQYDVDGLAEAQREFLSAGITSSVAALVDRLEWLGLLAWRDAEVVDVTGVPARRGGRAALTPLGEWFARPLAADRGYDTPTADDWADADATELLASAAQWPRERAEATVRRWARGREGATDELVAVAGATDDVALRVGAVEAVAAIADDGEAAVRRLRHEPALQPLATLWLVDRDLLDPDELDLAVLLSVFAEQLAIALAESGPDAVLDMLEDADGLLGDMPVMQVVAELWRVPGPATAAVLDALAASPDKTLAKSARTARFKLRSAR